MRMSMSMLAVLLAVPLLTAADEKPVKDSSAGAFALDKVWSMHLTIAPEQWKKMQPPQRDRGFGPPGSAPRPAAKPATGTTKKVRSMFGFEYEYVKGDLEIDGRLFKDVGVRYKGNASYASSQRRLKRPFKIDLNRYNRGQSFMGEKKLTLNNNVMDAAALREALSYKAYHLLDVPAPRTAYARLTLSVPGKYDNEFVGLYTLIESIDKTFLKKRFGSAKGLLLKPERVGPMEYLGDEWTAYQSRYQPKTPGDDKSKRRLIDFAKLVQKGDDKTFKAKIGDYLDVDEFLRFVAVTASLANMDSFIGLTHNYFMYLDPKTNKFVFLPWDLDLSFGAFGMMGSSEDMMDLSIKQPYTNRNRLIERLFADKKIFAVYKGHLRTLLAKGFNAETVRKDVTAINAILDPIKEKEKEAVAARHEEGRRGGPRFNRAPDVVTFVAKRGESIVAQLDGKRKGKVLRGGFGRGGFRPADFLSRAIREAADKNKDGKLTQEELSAALRLLFAEADKNKDGQLDEKELMDALNKLVPPPPFGPPGGPGFGPPGGPGSGPPGGSPRGSDAPKPGQRERNREGR